MLNGSINSSSFTKKVIIKLFNKYNLISRIITIKTKNKTSNYLLRRVNLTPFFKSKSHQRLRQLNNHLLYDEDNLYWIQSMIKMKI